MREERNEMSGQGRGRTKVGERRKWNGKEKGEKRICVDHP